MERSVLYLQTLLRFWANLSLLSRVLSHLYLIFILNSQ